MSCMGDGRKTFVCASSPFAATHGAWGNLEGVAFWVPRVAKQVLLTNLHVLHGGSGGRCVYCFRIPGVAFGSSFKKNPGDSLRILGI